NNGREFPRSALPWAVDETSLEPRLVPQDGETRAIYRRPPTPDGGPDPRADGLPGTATLSGATVPERKDLAPGDKKETPPPQPRQPVPAEGLEFVGKASKIGEFKLLLLYPRESTLSSRLGRLQPGRRNLNRRVSWTEVAVTLDLPK